MTNNIHDRIRKLLSLASNNSSASEAASALDKASRLMAEHGITQAQLGEKSSIEVNDARINATDKYVEVFAAAAALLFSCRSILSKSENTVIFVGRRDVTDAAVMAMQSFEEQARTLYRSVLPPGLTKRDRAVWRQDFYRACSLRLYNRVASIMEQRERTSADRALIVHTKSNLDEIDAFMQPYGMREKRDVIKPRNHDAAHAGIVSGDAIKVRENVT